MYLTFMSLVYGIAALAIVKLVSGATNRRWLARENTRHGCQPAPVVAKRDPLGLLGVLDILKATKAQRGPQYMGSLMNEIGTNIHTVRVPILDYELLVTRDPENAKVLLTESQSFEIGTYRAGMFEPLIGLGIMTLKGDAWRHSRALVRPQFSREQLSDLDLEEGHLSVLSKALKMGEDGWTEKADLQPLFLNFTLDTATEFLYGSSVHSQQVIQDINDPERTDFGHHLDAGKAFIQTRGVFGKYYWMLHTRKFARHCKEVHKYVDRFVQSSLRHEAKSSRMMAEPTPKKKFVLLDELAKKTQNPVELRNESLHLLSAGRDTTGALLSWVFYFLSRHPMVFEKLRATVLAEFGTDRAMGDITLAKLRSCQFLHHCINEAFRMVSIVPIMERVCIKDTTLPNGGGVGGTKPIFVPEGQRVLISTYAMQHRVDIWGQDAEEYNPDRWEGRKTGWEFFPFGAGPRKCVGRESLSLNFVM